MLFVGMWAPVSGRAAPFLSRSFSCNSHACFSVVSVGSVHVASCCESCVLHFRLCLAGDEPLQSGQEPGLWPLSPLASYGPFTPLTAGGVLSGHLWQREE